jgi:uncharacterized protein
MTSLTLNDIPAFQSKAEAGDPVAQYVLGSAYLRGEPVPRNQELGLSLRRRAAEAGYAKAQYALGIDYQKGMGVPQSRAEAAKWFAMAAEQDDCDGQYALGMHYAEEHRYDEALEFLRDSAIQGNQHAQISLGMMYEKGLGAAQDYSVAADWYLKAIVNPHNFGGRCRAQEKLGRLYLEGNGVPQDYVEAYKWLTLCAPEKIRNQIPLTPAERLEAQRRAEEWKKLNPQLGP